MKTSQRYEQAQDEEVMEIEVQDDELPDWARATTKSPVPESSEPMEDELPSEIIEEDELGNNDSQFQEIEDLINVN